MPLVFVCILCTLLASIVAAENLIVVDFYYSVSCGSCQAYIPIVDEVTAYYAENYSGIVVINKKEIGNKTNRDEMHARGLSYPSLVVNSSNNETRIPKANMTYNETVEVIDGYIANLNKKTYENDVIDIPYIGRVNLSSLSLPVLTVVLGALDSFNPCAFFILIILLSMLMYLQSRKRMILVGSIFIFFSGLFYALFMFILFNSVYLTLEYIRITSFIIGIVACSIGILNIKDFFFFKQGPTLSIPKEKRTETFKRMRKLVKSPSLLAMLGGTIFLAVSVNFFELICTLGFPMIYTSRLALEKIPLTTQYLYIFLYNVVYVIPLIIILMLFVFTLGSRKLTEWQGRFLKLLPGVMILSFGVCFVIDYMLLENIGFILTLMIADILATILIFFLWKQNKEKPEDIQPKELE